MTKYKVIRKPGSAAGKVARALNEAAEEGYILQFVDSGDYIMAKWDSVEDTEKKKWWEEEDADTVKAKDENLDDCPVPLARENENEDEEEYPWELDMAHPFWKPRPIWDGKKWK